LRDAYENLIECDWISMTEKVFISYARKDARELALRLQADLQSREIEAWLDTNEIEGGASWTKEIEVVPPADPKYAGWVYSSCRNKHLRIYGQQSHDDRAFVNEYGLS
jgi:hypothetical protein